MLYDPTLLVIEQLNPADPPIDVLVHACEKVNINLEDISEAVGELEQSVSSIGNPAAQDVQPGTFGGELGEAYTFPGPIVFNGLYSLFQTSHADDVVLYISNTTAGRTASLRVQGFVESAMGFRIDGAAPNGKYLRGNGTNFVASDLLIADLTGTLDGNRLPGLSTTKRGGVAPTGTPTGRYYRDSGAWEDLNADQITAGTVDGARLPGLSAAKRGGVAPTGTPSGKVLSDNDEWVDPGALTHINTIEFGNNNSAVKLVWHAAAANGDYSFQILRASGENGNVTLSNRGTGVYVIDSGGELHLYAGGQRRVQIASDGKAGFGCDSDAGYQIKTAGNINATGYMTAVNGYRVNNVSPTAGTYLRGDGTYFVSNTIQAADLPTGIAPSKLSPGTFGGVGSDTYALPGTLQLNARDYANYYGGGIVFKAGSGSNDIGFHQFGNTIQVWTSDSNNHYAIEFWNIGTGRNFNFTLDGNMMPSADETFDIGSDTVRFQRGYFEQLYDRDASLNTSDETLKEDVTECALGSDFLSRLKPIQFKWKNAEPKDETVVIQEGGYNDYGAWFPPITKTYHHEQTFVRRHFGLSAQQVKAVLDELEIDPKDFAPWAKMESGKLGIRYGELIPILIQAHNEQRSRISDLENTIASLVTRIEALETA
jgi:hypothetical protein